MCRPENVSSRCHHWHRQTAILQFVRTPSETKEPGVSVHFSQFSASEKRNTWPSHGLAPSLGGPGGDGYAQQAGHVAQEAPGAELLWLGFVGFGLVGLRTEKGIQEENCPN